MDGNKQIYFISNEEAISTKVATKSVLFSFIVDVEEHQNVSTMDIPNAFIQTHTKDEKDTAIINIRVVLVDILLEISPDVYGPYVITEQKGVKQLIVQCQNAIYGTMMASLLYYKKFRKIL